MDWKQLESPRRGYKSTVKEAKDYCPVSADPISSRYVDAEVGWKIAMEAYRPAISA